MEQEDNAHQRNHRELFDQRVAEGSDGPFDQAGPVIGNRDFDIVRQARAQLRQPCLDAGNRRAGIGARAHHDDAAHGFAFAIPIGQPATDLGTHGDARHVAKQDRNTPWPRGEHHGLEIANVLDIAAPAHHELALGDLHQPSTDVEIGPLYRLLDGRQ